MTSISTTLPTDTQNYRFAGVQSRMQGGTVIDANYAAGFAQLVASDGTTLLLPNKTTIIDGLPGLDLTRLAVYLMGYDGANWDRVRNTAEFGLWTDIQRMPTVSTSTDVSLASATTSAQLAAANSARKGLLLTNTDANDAYIYYGTTASPTKFSVKIPAGAYWEMPQPIYSGRIDAIWAANGSGSLIGSEL